MRYERKISKDDARELFVEYNNEDGNSVSLMDLLGSPDTNIQNIENIDLLKKKIATFNPIEKTIVEQRFSGKIPEGSFSAHSEIANDCFTN